MGKTMLRFVIQHTSSVSDTLSWLQLTPSQSFTRFLAFVHPKKQHGLCDFGHEKPNEKDANEQILMYANSAS
jgi:hypothetical protein